MAQFDYDRHLNFETVSNFRDLGGYRTREGKTVAWRRLFRSGELCRVSSYEHSRIKEELRLNSIIDLRNSTELERQGNRPVTEFSIRYYNIPFVTNSDDMQKEIKHITKLSNMGEVYLYFLSFAEYGRRVVKALEIVADPSNHPLVFHCAIGKDRTGILAAMVLSILGVDDKTIVEDYTLSGPYMKPIRDRLNNNPDAPADIKALPVYFWESTSDSMALFLDGIKKEYGSVKEYLLLHGADAALFSRLEKALLI